MGGDDTRRPHLARIKLEALVAEHFAPGEPEAIPFPPGAGMRSGGGGWVYFADATGPALGQALIWAQAWGIDDLHVLIDADVPSLTRQAAALTLDTTVWLVDGREIRSLPATPAAEPAPTPDADALVGLMQEAGVEVVVEHGAHIGEVLGLEIARVVDSPDGPELLIGVGRNDQEASRLLSEDGDERRRLDAAVAEARRWRTGNAEPHPLNRLARERWLRAMAVVDPGLVLEDELVPIPPVEPRKGLGVSYPCAALGTGPDGDALAVFSVGVDLEVVPVAAELAQIHHPEAIVLAGPARDQLPVIEGLVGLLPVPASLVALEPPWPTT